MVCLLPMGSDPSASIEALAEKLKVGELFFIFGPFFIQWIRTLYDSPVVKIKNNGHLSEGKVTRSQL